MRPSVSLFYTAARAVAPRGAQPWGAHCIPAPTPFASVPRTSTVRWPSFSPLLSWARASRAIRLVSNAASLPASSQAPESRLDRDQVPAYELTFTCNACKTRSSHRLSKQGYHHGTVLISCPGCKARHLISDHLKIFSDKSVTIEDLMREKGNLVKKGSLNAEGDVELWDDGSTTPRSAHFHPDSKPEGGNRFTEPPASSKPQV